MGILHKNDIHNKIKSGVDKIADAVKVTLGPRGSNVILRNEYGEINVTKDGVSVAEAVYSTDVYENTAIEIVKEASQKTADLTGDGTTTSMTLTQFLYNEGRNTKNFGVFKKGMNYGYKLALDELNKIKRDINSYDDKKAIATISANNDTEIGSIIADAIDASGQYGVVTLKEGMKPFTYIEKSKGLDFKNGYLSHHFINNNNTSSFSAENLKILIIQGVVNNFNSLIPILENLKGQLLIICEEIEDNPLDLLTQNVRKGLLSLCVVRTPGYGEKRRFWAQDIAIATGGIVWNQELDFEEEMFGHCESVTVTSKTTSIIGGIGDVSDRIEQLSKELENTNEYESKFIRERRGKLSDGIVVIYVGAPTEVEAKQLFDRVEDALFATQTAIRSGYLIGGGCALLKSRNFKAEIKEEAPQEFKDGVELIRRALEVPFRQILENAFLNPDEYIESLSNNDNIGLDLIKEKVCDLFDAGIIDPFDVVKATLENSISVASMLISSNCMVIREKEEIRKI